MRPLELFCLELTLKVNELHPRLTFMVRTAEDDHYGARVLTSMEAILDMDAEMSPSVLKLNWTLIDDPPPELEIPHLTRLTIRRESKEAAVVCQALQATRTAFPELFNGIRFGYWTISPKEWRKDHPERCYAFVPTEYL